MADDQVLEDLPELFKDYQMGELNALSLNPEDPLITNSFDGKSLLSGLFNKFMQRESLFDGTTPKKAVVLLSSAVQTSGVILEKTFPDLGPLQKLVNVGGLVGNSRNFAVIRIPEMHGHIPMPSMQKLMEANEAGVAAGQLPDRDKLLLSMHDACFSAPVKILGDMPALNPGDIVLVDGDGMIIQLVEPNELGIWGSMTGKLSSALDWAKDAVGLDGRGTPTEETPYGLKYTHRSEPPKWIGVMIHYNGGANIGNTVDVLGKRGASYHYMIERDGTTEMGISPDHKAWHGGDANSQYIGISLMNWGNTPYDGGISWVNGLIDKPNTDPKKPEWARQITQKYDYSTWVNVVPGDLSWEPYPAAQISALKSLIGQLKAKYPTLEYVCGHEDYSSTKVDPGPLFDSYYDTLGLKRGKYEPSRKNRSTDTRSDLSPTIPGD